MARLLRQAAGRPDYPQKLLPPLGREKGVARDQFRGSHHLSPPMNNSKRLADIDWLLDQHKRPFKCVEGCADCCGPIIMSRLEAKRIARRTGQSTKNLTNAMQRAIITKGQHCPLLDQQTSKCTVYDIRPAICRLFGAVADEPRLTCQHGRRPDNLLPKQSARTILRAVEIKGLGYDQTTAQEFRAWHETTDRFVKQRYEKGGLLSMLEKLRTP